MKYSHLKQRKWEGGDPLGIINHGNEPDVFPGMKTAQVIDGAVAFRLQKQHPFVVAVYFDTTGLVPPQPPCNGIEVNQRLAQRRLHHRRVEEVSAAVGAEEVDADSMVGRRH